MYETYPRHDHLGLASLQVPDEVPLEAIPEALLFLDEVLGPVLANEVNVGRRRGPRAALARSTWWRRARGLARPARPPRSRAP